MKGLLLILSLLITWGIVSCYQPEKEKPPLKPLKKALLVTAASLSEAWVPFVVWKESQGIAVEVVSVEEIDGTVEGPDLPEKIRRYVQAQIADEGLHWLVLGGDSLPGGEGLVPDRDTFHETVWGRDSSVPTDIYYLSPTDWDADGDGVYGEFEDDREAITYPDGRIGLGRIPVRTVADVAAYTAKVVAYESGSTGGFFDQSFLYTCTVAGAYPKVRRSWDESVSEVLPEVAVERYFAHETPWDEQSPGDYPLNTENWINLFNEKRVGKMHLHGHGHLPGWVMEDNRSLFTFDHVDQLRNEGAYPIITTVSCFTGHFDAESDPSIAEAILRAPEAGAIIVVAPSREGKPHFLNPREDFPLMMREGKLDGTTRAMTSFWVNGIGGNLSAGEAFIASKVEQVEKANQSASFHLCLCELNLLGDPTIEVQRTEPKEVR